MIIVWENELVRLKFKFSLTLAGQLVLHIDLWQHVSSGFLHKILHLCLRINKRIAEINHMNWEPERNVWVLKIYNDKRFTIDPQICKQTGGQSGEVGIQSRSLLDHWPWKPVALHWEVALISPVKEVLSGALKIDQSQRGVNMNKCPQCGVNDSSPSPLSLCLSILLAAFRIFCDNRDIFL